MSLIRKFEEESNDMPTSPDTNGPPPQKKQLVFEPVRLSAVSTLDELDVEVLRFQHSKLKQRLEQRQRSEQALLERIQQLEKRQTTDDAVLNVTNRYWNQLNEDVRILLQRFDKETLDEDESKNENEYTTSFLAQLSTWDKDELGQKLANRVQVSTRAVAKVIQAFDRLQQRSAKITAALESDESLDELVKDRNVLLEEENKRLQALSTRLHEQHRIMSLKMKEMEEKYNSEETKGDELRNQVDDLSWEVSKLLCSQDKLEVQIHELQDRNKRLQQLHDLQQGSRECDLSVMRKFDVNVSEDEVMLLKKENEELRELATNRLVELERLHQTHKGALEDVEKLKMDIRNLPESVITETTEYKSLQSKFSVVYNDSLTLRQSLDEIRNHLITVRSAYVKTTEQLENEELLVQKKWRTEAIQLEDMLSQVRKEYEKLRIEFEQKQAANEQNGPINREMRHLITSLQNHNTQLKGDAQRYRRKYKDISNDATKLRRERDDLELKFHSLRVKHQECESACADSGLTGFKDEADSPSSSSSIRVDTSSPSGNHEVESSNYAIHVDHVNKLNDIKREAQLRKADEAAETIKDLKAKLKQALLSQKETKLLLDMYKGVSKEQRDKAQLMAAEKKVRGELDESKLLVQKYQESQKEEKKKLADEEAIRRIKILEDQVQNLQRQVTTHNSEGETLISEMEVTGQAFEDMQEQNSRLIQQLREKDDANFKLMSDKIKSNQLQRFAREERELLKDQLTTLTKQVEAQNSVVRKLEEKERVLMTTLGLQDKEALLRAQSAELSRRKAIEAAQSAADLKLHLDKYHSQMKDAQQTVAEKTSALEAEAFKARRFQEQIASLSRKVERLNKIEMAGNTDEVMQEEIREYKESLTCPSCKVKRKDAVLTKCFHVFCFDCLRTRYETRQRKCPKCNACFGANDYHRLYLT